MCGLSGHRRLRTCAGCPVAVGPGLQSFGVLVRNDRSTCFWIVVRTEWETVRYFLSIVPARCSRSSAVPEVSSSSMTLSMVTFYLKPFQMKFLTCLLACVKRIFTCIFHLICTKVNREPGNKNVPLILPQSLGSSHHGTSLPAFGPPS